MFTKSSIGNARRWTHLNLRHVIHPHRSGNSEASHVQSHGARLRQPTFSRVASKALRVVDVPTGAKPGARWVLGKYHVRQTSRLTALPCITHLTMSVVHVVAVHAPPGTIAGVLPVRTVRRSANHSVEDSLWSVADLCTGHPFEARGFDSSACTPVVIS